MNNLNTINIKAQKIPLDKSTNSMLRFKQGDDLSFRLGVFSDSESLASLENVESLHFEIYDIGSYQSPSPRVSTLYIKKIVDSEDINYNLSLDDWNNGTSQHATFNVGVEESNLEAGEKWLKISAQLENQKLITISAGWIEIEENFTNYTQAEAIDVEVWKNAALVAKEAAQESAESASESASLAGASAESAEASATSASSSAESAQGYTNNAESSASSASSSAESADSSASSAGESASSASSSAISASASASSALSASASAETSATSASASATSATNSASSASTSASSATASASEASSSATNAATSATSASASASTATTKASEASTSASTSTTQASNAATSATSAATSATSAAASVASIATTSALAQLAQKRGEVYFPFYSRCYKSSVDVFPSFPVTICINAASYSHSYSTDTTYTDCTFIQMTNTSTNRGVHLSYDWSSGFFYFGVSTGYATRAAARVYYPLENGKMYNIIATTGELEVNSSGAYYLPNAKIYVNGVDIGAYSYNTTGTAWAPADDETFGIYFNQSSYLMLYERMRCQSKISDAKIFNFTLPINDAADTDGIGYTMQDYINGLDIPIELQSSTATNRCIYSSMNTTYTIGSTKYLMSEIGGDLTCVASTYSSVNYASPQSTDENRFMAQVNATISNA